MCSVILVKKNNKKKNRRGKLFKSRRRNPHFEFSNSDPQKMSLYSPFEGVKL